MFEISEYEEFRATPSKILLELPQTFHQVIEEQKDIWVTRCDGQYRFTKERLKE